MQLSLSGNPADFARQVDLETKRLARGLRAGVVATTDEVKRLLRAPILASGFNGAKALANAWQGKVYPARDNGTFRPAGLIYSKTPDIHRGMDRGGIIVPKAGRFLAIPSSVNLVTQGGAGRSKQLRVTTAQMMEPTSGAFVLPRKSGPGLLWCLPVRGSGARLTAAGRRVYSKSNGRDRAAVQARGFAVMFTLVPSLRSRKVLDIEGVRRLVPAMLLANIGAALTREG